VLIDRQAAKHMISPQQAWAVASALWQQAAAEARNSNKRILRHAWALVQQHPTLGAFLDVHASSPAAQWLALAAVGLTGVAMMIVAGLVLWLMQRRLWRLLRRGQQVVEEETVAPATGGAAVADAAGSVGWPLQTVTPEKAMAARYCTALFCAALWRPGSVRASCHRAREIALGRAVLARNKGFQN
jgi:hypothetical protein